MCVLYTSIVCVFHPLFFFEHETYDFVTRKMLFCLFTRVDFVKQLYKPIASDMSHHSFDAVDQCFSINVYRMHVTYI